MQKTGGTIMRKALLMILLSLAVIITMIPMAPVSDATDNDPYVKGVVMPVAGEKPTTAGITVTGDGYTFKKAAWHTSYYYGGDESIPVFKLGKEYWLEIVIESASVIDYDDPPDVYVNGTKKNIDYEDEADCEIKGNTITYWVNMGEASTINFAVTTKGKDGDTEFETTAGKSISMKAYNAPAGDIVYQWWECDSKGNDKGSVLLSNKTGKFSLKKLGYNYGRNYFLCRAIASDGQIAEVVLRLTCYYDLKGANITVRDVTYNGKTSRSPKVTIKAKVNGKTKTLVKGTDFKLDFEKKAAKRKDVGSYRFTITGKKYFKYNYNYDEGDYDDDPGDGEDETSDYYDHSFKIVPKGTSVRSVKAGSGKLTVEWKRQSQKMSAKRITGYQVQIATNKAFTKNKKTKKIKGYKNVKTAFGKLKHGKKYYVHVRTYKTINGVTCYSKWSSVKTKTTK